MEWENKSNNEILLELKEMQEEHEAIKRVLLKYYNTLESIEKEFNKGNEVFNKRLIGE